MILADTSVWAEHLRKKGHPLGRKLVEAEIVMHPLVIGELACGNLANRKETLERLKSLPGAVQASEEEVLQFLEHHGLAGSGLGIVDVHLLASASLTPAALWTSDRPLERAARKVQVELATETE